LHKIVPPQPTHYVILYKTSEQTFHGEILGIRFLNEKDVIKLVKLNWQKIYIIFTKRGKYKIISPEIGAN